MKFEMKTIHFNFHYTINHPPTIFLKSEWFRSSRTLVTRTLKGNENQFELAGNSSYPISSYRGSTVVSLCQDLAHRRRAKKPRVQWNSERAKNGGKRANVSIFCNTSIHLVPRPLPEKPFLVSKCQISKRQKVRCSRGFTCYTCLFVRDREIVYSSFKVRALNWIKRCKWI